MVYFNGEFNMAVSESSFLMNGIRTNSLGSDRPHRMNRYMGGHARKTQPYVSGYWYFMLLTPDRIFGNDASLNANAGSEALTTTNPSNSNQNPAGAVGSAVSDQASADLWFHSAAESFTPPTTNITKIDIPGMGGLGSSFIGGREITRTFTVTLREYTNLPIMSLLRRWNSVLDPYYGVSPLKAAEWMPMAYKGVACAFLCKPTVGEGNTKILTPEDVEQMYYFDGVWPETQPDDSFNTDIASNESLQLSVTFSFDGWAYNKEAFANAGASSPIRQAIALFNTRYSLEETQTHVETLVFPTAIK